MQEYILIFDGNDADALGNVRCYKGLLAATDDEHVWLRGIYNFDDIELKKLPAKKTFLLDDKNNLFVPGMITPVDSLKEFSWQPLTEFIKVEAPVSAMPGRNEKQISFSLIPSVEVKEGAALLTSLQIWKQYAETAPGIRLQRLVFAVSEKNEVIIMGHPLPPLPGREYWKWSNLLIPSGYDFDLSITAQFMEQQLNANPQAFILLDDEGSWKRVEKSFFVKAKRSAVRLTKMNI